MHSPRVQCRPGLVPSGSSAAPRADDRRLAAIWSGERTLPQQNSDHLLPGAVEGLLQVGEQLVGIHDAEHGETIVVTRGRATGRVRGALPLEVHYVAWSDLLTVVHVPGEAPGRRWEDLVRNLVLMDAEDALTIGARARLIRRRRGMGLGSPGSARATCRCWSAGSAGSSAGGCWRTWPGRWVAPWPT